MSLLKRGKQVGIALAASVAFSTAAQAAPQIFTDRTLFEAAIANINNVTTAVEDFQGFAPNDASSVLTEGVDINGITYNSVIPAPFNLLAVGGNTAAFGPNNFLGVAPTPGGAPSSFGFTDVLNLSFAESHAFGFNLLFQDTVVTADEITLSFANAQVSNAALTFPPNNVPTTELFFGIVDPDMTYTTANITFSNNTFEGGVGFLDNFTRTVATTPTNPPMEIPVPASVTFLGFGILSLTFLARRRRV